MMPDVDQLYNRHRKYMLFILAFVVLGWGFSSYPSVFAGLFLGIAVGFLNMKQLAGKTIRLSEAVSSGKTVYSLGTFSRLAFAALAVMIAIRFPNTFHLIATIIGLTVSYIVIFIDLIVLFFTKRLRQEER